MPDDRDLLVIVISLAIIGIGLVAALKAAGLSPDANRAALADRALTACGRKPDSVGGHASYGTTEIGYSQK
jgi:type II secretory pathway pseudopilin PulG